MTWPQIAIAIWMTWMFVEGFLKLARDREMRPAEVTAAVFLLLVEVAGAALVLSAGGFW